jgi:hypothetical protein
MTKRGETTSTSEYNALRGAVKKAGKNPPDEVLHALRIKGKRLRYTGELAEPALGRPVSRMLSATAEPQKVLGEHQDAHVAQQRIREPRAGIEALLEAEYEFEIVGMCSTFDELISWSTGTPRTSWSPISGCLRRSPMRGSGRRKNCGGGVPRLGWSPCLSS